MMFRRQKTRRKARGDYGETMRKLSLILAATSALVLTPARAELPEPIPCRLLALTFYKVMAAINSCNLPVPTPDNTPDILIEYQARVLSGTCTEADTSKKVMEEGEALFRDDVAAMGHSNACWRIRKVLEGGR
jgi:hypothetical protein